jgi:hypothetical protein
MRILPTANNVIAPVQQLLIKPLPPSRLPQLSPTKAGFVSPYAATAAAKQQQVPGSPTRNMENTPPNIPRSPKKEQGAFLTQAAQSRAEPYRTRDAAEVGSQRPGYMQKGLTAEDLEKLHKPSVRRLANVTQLCRF